MGSPKLTKKEAEERSKPFFTGFDPYVIPYQGDVIDFLYGKFDYAVGTPEILLSGSYGSAKSILMAHIAVKHLMENPGGRCCLARKSMPDLKDTIFKEVLEHLAEDFEEGVDYTVNSTRASITFANGSELISRSWADKKYKKGRSLKLSMLIFEELTENDDDDKAAFMTLKARLRRLPNIKENILIAATNPDSPAHWVHKYFIDEPSETKFVFYSVTTDNPFLDPIYVEQLKADLSPRDADRYIRGMWVEIDRERVYYAYTQDKNYVRSVYTIRNDLPIAICFDFNIGAKKPMSCALGQFHPETQSFHIFAVSIIEGARTLDVMEDLGGRGLLDRDVIYQIYGDSSGQSNDTRSKRTDYDQIKNFLSNFERRDGRVGVRFEFCVPAANPPVRERHNTVNAFCLNERAEHRFFIYEGEKLPAGIKETDTQKSKRCAKADEGMRLVALKKGANYIEDDSKDYQHVTTALGYWVVYIARKIKLQDSLRKAGHI